MNLDQLITEVQELYDGANTAMLIPTYRALSYLWDAKLIQANPHLRPADCLVFLESFWSNRTQDTPVHAAVMGGSRPITYLSLCGARESEKGNAVHIEAHVPNCPECIEKLKTGVR